MSFCKNSNCIIHNDGKLWSPTCVMERKRGVYPVVSWVLWCFGANKYWIHIFILTLLGYYIYSIFLFLFHIQSWCRTNVVSAVRNKYWCVWISCLNLFKVLFWFLTEICGYTLLYFLLSWHPLNISCYVLSTQLHFSPWHLLVLFSWQKAHLLLSKKGDDCNELLQDKSIYREGLFIALQIFPSYKILYKCCMARLVPTQQVQNHILFKPFTEKWS